jgi:mycothiol synthase
MIALREAESDADLEDWIRVRRAVLPNESGGTVASLRAQAGPERRLLLAEFDGELAGSGLADRSDVSDRFFVTARVLPGARRRGVGTALLRSLAAHAERFDVQQVSTHLEEPEARGFAERFGFREIDRQVEQVKTLGDEPAPPPLDGLEVMTIAERAATPTSRSTGSPRCRSTTGCARRRRCRQARSSRSRTARSSASAA